MTVPVVRAKARNQWFTRGQKRDFALIIPPSLAATAYAHSGEKAKVGKRDSRDRNRMLAGAAGGAGLAAAADSAVGAGLKQADRVARDRYKAKASPEQWAAVNRAQKEHGVNQGLDLRDKRGRPRLLDISDADTVTNRQKNSYYRSYPTKTTEAHGIAGLKVPGARAKRLNSHRDLKIKSIVTAGALLGGGLAARKVEKRAPVVNSTLRVLRDHKVAIGLPVGVAAAAGSQGGRSSGGHRKEQAAGAAIGGQAAFRAAGYGAKLHSQAEEKRAKTVGWPRSPGGAPEPYTRSQRNKHLSQAIRDAKLEGVPGKKDHEAKAKLYRNIPKDAPGARGARLAGHMAGRRGLAINAAATALPAAAVLGKRPVEKRQGDDERARKLRRNDKVQMVGGGAGVLGGLALAHGRKPTERLAMVVPGVLGMGQAAYDLRQDEYGWSPAERARRGLVKKSVTYGYQERRRDKVRTAQLGAGLTLGAYGASRLPVGQQVQRGVKYAEARGYGAEARSAADTLRSGRNQVRNVTGQASAAARRIPGMGTALDMVPKKMRPGFALGAGALLAARAIPTHDERFVPTGRF